MLHPGVDIELIPEKPVAGGRMLGRHDGQIVLVRGAIPGERVRARVERASRDVAHAVVVEILDPHPDRRSSDVHAECGGNALAHVAYARQLELKSEIVRDAFMRLAHLSLAGIDRVTASPERGYRMRARFHVRGGRAGFYLEGSHELCDPRTSGQLQPEAIDAAQLVAGMLQEPGSAWDAGIELTENIAGDARALHVELQKAAWARPLTEVRAVPGLTGLSWSDARDRQTHVVFGEPYVRDRLDLQPWDGGATAPALVRRHVRAFFQGNRYLLSELVERVLSLVPAGPVADLYAGVGLFAVALASTRPGRVVAVESDALSARDLAANSEACGHPFECQHLTVESFLREAADGTEWTMVLDPPRTGLSRDVVAALLQRLPDRLVYVSCDVATLARDLKHLTQGYDLAHVEVMDLFPNTAHVETIVALQRRRNVSKRESVSD